MAKTFYHTYQFLHLPHVGCCFLESLIWCNFERTYKLLGSFIQVCHNVQYKKTDMKLAYSLWGIVRTVMMSPYIIWQGQNLNWLRLVVINLRVVASALPVDRWNVWNSPSGVDVYLVRLSTTSRQRAKQVPFSTSSSWIWRRHRLRVVPESKSRTGTPV